LQLWSGDFTGVGRSVGGAKPWGRLSRTGAAPESGSAPERIEEALRAASLEQEFATAWAEGRAMSLEQAIAFALEELPDG
jgi:hypothetical protein